MRVEIWHNPACSASRNTLALIRGTGIEPVIVDYLHASLDTRYLSQKIAAAGLSVREAVRTKQPEYKALGLDDLSLNDEALLDAMLANPILIQRPLVSSPLGVRMCRPAERVLEILPKG